VSGSAPPAETAWPPLVSKLFEFLGVDQIQYQTLVRSGFLIDLRASAQVASGGRETETPLRSSLTLYAVYSAFLGLLAFAIPAGLYGRVMMIFGMTLMGMIMLVDFGVTLVVPEDLVILGWRPISSRTYFAAKLTNALAFIAMFAGALFTLPSILGVFSKGASMLFPLLFLPCAVLGSVFVAGLVAASYAALLRVFSAERFRSAVNYLQIAMMATLMVGSQLGPRLEGRNALRAMRGQSLDTAAWSWWDLLPPHWFCAPSEALLGGAGARTLALSAMAFTVTAALFIVLTRSLSFRYLEQVHGSGSSAPSPNRSSDGHTPLVLRAISTLFRTNEENVMFNLIRIVIARDRQVRLRVYPMMAYSLVVLPAIILFPASSGERHVSMGLMNITPLIVLTLLPSVILPLLPYAGESQGAWIFELTGFENSGSVASGIKKSLFCLFLAPLASISLAGLAFFVGMGQAALWVVFGLSSSMLLTQIAFMGLYSGLPFTRKMVKGKAASRMAYVLLCYLVIGALGALAYFVLDTTIRVLIATGVLIAGAAVLNSIGNSNFRPFDVGPQTDEPVGLIQ